MVLKFSYSDGTSKDFTESEEAEINKSLDRMLSRDFGKGRVRQMIADGLELRRLDEALTQPDLDAAKKQSLRDAFYSLAAKIRKQTKSAVNLEQIRVKHAVEGTAAVHMPPAQHFAKGGPIVAVTVVRSPIRVRRVEHQVGRVDDDSSSSDKPKKRRDVDDGVVLSS